MLMGVFGEGGTGKSTLIEAVRVWFQRNNRGHELIVTATTGSAAVKINGSTVHSAVCIPIETSDGKRVGRLTPKKIAQWTERRYREKWKYRIHGRTTLSKLNPMRLMNARVLDVREARNTVDDARVRAWLQLS